MGSKQIKRVVILFLLVLTLISSVSAQTMTNKYIVLPTDIYDTNSQCFTNESALDIG